MGLVRSIAQTTTNVMYMIDDQTGTIDLRVWIDAQTGNDRYRDMWVAEKRNIRF